MGNRLLPWWVFSLPLCFTPLLFAQATQPRVCPDLAKPCAGFKANDPDGHCLQNRSGHDASVLEIGTRLADDMAHYSDIDMVAPAGGKPAVYTKRDGTPYEGIKRRGP